MIIDHILQYSLGLLVLYWLLANEDRRERAKEIFIHTVERLEGKK